MPTPKPDIQGIKKFKEYRNKGLTYREIIAIMGKGKKTLMRWNNYIKQGVLDGDKLSTGK